MSRRDLVFSLAAAALVTQFALCAPSATVYTGWPFAAAEATQRQADTAKALGCEVTREVKLPGGVTLTLVLIPAGELVMGAPADESRLDPDESPPFKLTVKRPFWLGKFEVTNQQFRAFRADHNSREIDTNWKDRVGPGPSVDGDQQPVCRISWFDAKAFCAWLSKSAGTPFRLPSEAEWEYACRAGTNTPLSCPAGELFRYANYADQSLGSVKPWALRDKDHSDGSAVSAAVGKYLPNPWGLCDMHGNVAEWCDTAYRAYPLSLSGPDVGLSPSAPRVVRGGSWDDRPRRVRSAFRLSYPPDYRVYNVGFRVMCPVQ
jgi:formylglycine-generating enzyme required for sulfatase activity